MTRDQLKTVVFRTLGSIAPEADLSQIKPDVALRDQLDVDSMDFLNFVIGLHKELNIEIPEADYPELSTLDGCVDYLNRIQDRAQQMGESL
ncbi:MAG TPA: phosphopantetheine-binding protein [Blastocatellia bacterium]|nr:phosphopantetheine-binding protein [Blastocatellia bacterium]